MFSSSSSAPVKLPILAENNRVSCIIALYSAQYIYLGTILVVWRSLPKQHAGVSVIEPPKPHWFRADIMLQLQDMSVKEGEVLWIRSVYILHEAEPVMRLS